MPLDTSLSSSGSTKAEARQSKRLILSIPDVQFSFTYDVPRDILYVCLYNNH